MEEKHPQTHNIPIGRIASWSRSIYSRSLDGQKSRFRVPLFFDLFYGPAIRDLDLVFYWRRKSISDVSGCLPTGRIGRVPRKIDSRSAMFGANVASGFALRSIWLPRVICCWQQFGACPTSLKVYRNASQVWCLLSFGCSGCRITLHAVRTQP